MRNLPPAGSLPADDSDFDDLNYPGDTATHLRPLNAVHLAAVLFIYSSSGPFGQGPILAAGGPRWAFVGVLALPWVYSLPLALMTCEQASRFPFCGGCVHWAFSLGRVVGHLNAMLRFLTNAFDNPMYPILAADFIGQAVPELVHDQLCRTVLYVPMLLAVVGLNLIGIQGVSSFAIFVIVFVLLPFVLFFFLATPGMSASVIFAPPQQGSLDIGVMFTSLYWGYSGFDTVASLAAEVKPDRSLFRRAYFGTLVVVCVMYIASGFAASAITTDPDTLYDLDYGMLSLSLPYCESGWLALWIRLAGFLSSMGTFLVAIAMTSREFYAGSIFGSFPFSAQIRRLAKTLGGETSPIVAMFLMTLFTIPFSYSDLTWLGEWSGILTVMQVLVQCAAFVAMRFPERVDAMMNARGDCKSEQWGEGMPDDQAFVLPWGWVGVALVVVPLVGVSGYLIYDTGWSAVVIMIAMLAGMSLLKGAEVGVMELIGRWRGGKTDGVGTGM
jgi:amino acid transporter